MISCILSDSKYRNKNHEMVNSDAISMKPVSCDGITDTLGAKLLKPLRSESNNPKNLKKKLERTP